jgi:Viral BACON domain/Putative binding domain, N-terminal
MAIARPPELHCFRFPAETRFPEDAMRMARLGIAIPLAVAAAALAACDHKTPSSASCSYTVVSQGVSFGGAGGTGSASVTTQSGCSWTAAAQVNWIQVPSEPKTGSGTVAFTVLPTSESQSRTGVLVVVGQTLSISQGVCRVAVQPEQVSFSSDGGPATLTVDADAGCGWRFEGVPAWIVLEPIEGVGSQSVTVKAAPQPDAVARDATLTIASTRVVVHQAPGKAACTYALSVDRASLTPATATVALRVDTGAACAWNMGTASTWVHFVDGPTGTGPAVVRAAIEANSGAPARQATIQAVNAAVTLTQQGQESCQYRVSPVQEFVRSAGGAGAVTIATSEGCAWTASTSASWLRVSQSSGTGSASVSFSAEQNPQIYVTDFRKAPVEFRWLAPSAGENAWLWQFGNCNTVLYPFEVGATPTNTVTVGAAGGSVHLQVLVESPFNCPWTIEVPPGLFFGVRPTSAISPAWRRGDGDVFLDVPPNPSLQPRSAVILIGEKPLTVKQAGG